MVRMRVSLLCEWVTWGSPARPAFKGGHALSPVSLSAVNSWAFQGLPQLLSHLLEVMLLPRMYQIQ